MATDTSPSGTASGGLGRNNLIASYYTLSGAPVGCPARFSFAARVAAAAAAGFSAIGLTVEDYQVCRERGLSPTTLRQILTDAGISVAELEFLTNWWRDDAVGEQARRLEDQLYEAAEIFGARHMNVGSIGERGTLPPRAVVAERFAALCDRAARHGLLVALEFLPWSDIPDASTAAAIVHQAARANGGILIDSWHYFRGAADPAQVRAIPADHFVAIQFDDADAVRVGGWLEDTTQHRRLPGEGAFDLIGFVQMLDTLGVQTPISVEIISTEHQARPLAEAAQRAYDTTRAVLTRARPA
jgi:sugar phosphate isomerase/epimerase